MAARTAKRTWNDEVTLLTVGTSVTESGIEVYGVIAEDTVLANKLPVKMTEFYSSSKEGFTISRAFEIHDIEYNEQEYLKYGDDYYRVRRRYDEVNYTELYCDKHDGDFEEV